MAEGLDAEVGLGVGGEAGGHVPVLVRQVLEVLDPGAGKVCLDCTVGRGGHGARIVPLLGARGRYIGIDADPGNVQAVRERLAGLAARVDVVHGNFEDAGGILGGLGVQKVDLLLADLGFASTQMEDAGRGFSFMHEGPLDMRLDPTCGQTAGEIVNTREEGELADILYRLGGERHSRKIASFIVERRRESPINTTTELAGLVRRAYAARERGRRSRRKRFGIDPATRTFMALRIAANDELGALTGLLDGLPGLVAEGGVAAVISFHSLEDRLVKRAFLRMANEGLGQVLTKKPLVASANERKANRRSRSAKLRAFKFVSG